MIQDIEDQHLYTDKLMIGVVDLTRLDLASETDQKYKVDKWARFFNAESWEDLRMLAQEYPVIEKAASYLKVLTEDEKYKLQQEAWEDNQRRINGIMQLKEKAEKEYAGLKAENEKLTKKAEDIVINMLRGSVPVDKIMEYTGYSSERISELAKANKISLT